MSLITDTLNKMKKEQGSEENEDKMMAPPALRNAVVNTKKYQEFVKNAEIKDIHGNKAPLKGFVIVSVILVAVIGTVTFYFLNKEDDSLVKQAGVISGGQQPAQVNNTVTSNSEIKSLGKPYNPNAQSASTDIKSNNAAPQKPVQVQQVNQQTANMQTAETGTAAQQTNNINGRKTQSSMSSMPDSAQVSGANKGSNAQVKQGPANIIPANQLFLITPPAVDNTGTQQENIKIENKKESSVKSTKTNSEQTSVKKQIDDKIMSAAGYDKVDMSKFNMNENTQKGQLYVAKNLSPEDKKNLEEFVQKELFDNGNVKQSMPVINAQNQQDNITSNQVTQVNAQVQQNNNINKDNSKEYSAKTEIAEVKAIKTKDPVGTVSASTISLYNQYVSTGNKAKNEGSYERAIEYYTNALALNKNDVLSANIANMYLELKNPNMAFQVTVKNGMTDAKLISALAVRMINSKYFLESNKLLQYANTLEKSSYILFANGYYAQSQKQYDTAVKYYKDAMAVNPADVSSAYYAALCFEEQGKNSDAVTMYQYIINNSSSPENMKKQASSRVKKLGN